MSSIADLINRTHHYVRW